MLRSPQLALLSWKTFPESYEKTEKQIYCRRSILIKDYAEIFVKPKLFNAVLRCCVFPSKWTISRAWPVYKSDQTGNNYRPISIICNFTKVVETVIYNNSYNIIGSLLSVSQHGFMKSCPSTTNFSTFCQFVTEVLLSESFWQD